MSLGLGVFLSVLLISFIFFPQQLLGRSKKFLKFILLPVIILISVISLFSYLYYLYTYETSKPMHSYWDINIGDSLKEVKFLKGNTNWATGEIISWGLKDRRIKVRNKEGVLGTIPLEDWYEHAVISGDSGGYTLETQMS